MYLTGNIRVKAVLPEQLSRLEDIAYNMWWSWNSCATDLFKEIDPDLWSKLNRNPVRFLQEISQQSLAEKVQDNDFMEKYHSVIDLYDKYMNSSNTWLEKTYPGKNNRLTAYFSAEFGLHEVLPIYSGGLGVLSGDHCKSASDLGIPFVAIGLFYKQGYFSQRINHDGWQETVFSSLNPSQLPILPITDENGERILISVDLPGRKLYAQVWKVQIGRVTLYLMDADLHINSSADRSITSRLYGGDQETRIQQEILLGIGGLRVLDILGIKPDIYHMNEGHSAFIGLELLRKLVSENSLSFEEAMEVSLSSLVFTTHTPVPAGSDVFPFHMMDKYFDGFWNGMGTNRDTFMKLGSKDSGSHEFNMTVLAMKLAGRRNGVSELHGAVTRNIFHDLWKDIPEEEVPVTHITNGVHTLSWVSKSFEALFNSFLNENWKQKLYDRQTWQQVHSIPDSQLWEEHCRLKKNMIEYIRERIREQKSKNGESPESIREVDTWLDPACLTIGFARRFATYKRADLIFRDMERIKSILNNSDRPVQIIFAGKAHPADRPAHEIIKKIHDISHQGEFKDRVMLIENYNMALARQLVSGVDIWLNNPRRPLEASGTSGQKVCINGIMNLSVLDGWWCEGYNGRNGWTVGDDTFYSNEYTQDNADSKSIYDTLENQIIPLYYRRNESGIPEGWVAVMKESIASITWQYSTHRMLQDYFEELYLPSIQRMDRMYETNYDFASQLAKWKSEIVKAWPGIRIYADNTSNSLKPFETVSTKPIQLSVYVDTGGINPDDFSVEVYYGIPGKNGIIREPNIKSLMPVEKTGESSYRYSTDIILVDGGDYIYTFRAIPKNENLINRFNMGLIRWVEE